MASNDVIMLESDYESDDFFDEDCDVEFEEENDVAKASKANKTTKGKGKGAKGTAVKKAAGSVLANSTNVDNIKSAEKQSDKTIEEIYQKKSQLEHILLRPDTYIGGVERVTEPMFVLNNETGRIAERDVTYTPGLFKIFDEIVVNAADNKQRDPKMDKIDIVIDQKANRISVKNNGKGIPVVEHKEHKCYVPTLIFGHLLTGSNFDDDEKKTTGGRNGYGAKLTNIYSTEFIVECVDSKNGLKFKQVFRNNMAESQDPVVAQCTSAEKKQGDFVKISFSPDLARFKMNYLDDDTVSLFSKRAYDIAGSMGNSSGKKLAVSLNGKKLPIKSFQDYLNLFDGMNAPAAYEKVGDRWEVGISVSEGSFQQVSFVNAICTSKGGSHVTFIADQVAASLAKTVKKKNKGGVEVKPNQIKNHLCVFVNCLVENPTFDSQTKQFLTTRSKAFGSECKLSDKFLKQVDKSGVVDSILSFAKFKQGQALKRQGGTKKNKLTGIPKLDDANFAGTAKSKDCTLIITEGDSAKSLAMSGLSVVGRDYYGVFPLKGKPLNVREASHKQITSNEEIKNLVDIMGLKFGTVYNETNIKTLRYGHLMIMADQDHDGSHIKGLVINFIHNFWPSLLDVPGFLQQFITPIVKVSKGKKSITFFTVPEYEAWRESTGNNAKGYTIKYYKGLGTSTSAEAKEYFSNLDLHEVHFSRISEDKRASGFDGDSGDDDEMSFGPEPVPEKVTSGSELIEMAFSKGRVDDRKAWLNSLKKDTYLNYAEAQDCGVKYSEFINKELILFSQADNARSIPHAMDGFKPSQRKVLFACLKRKLKSEIKVAQLAGYVGEHSAYHHGEASLTGTIVNMAQCFCGSNNINLLTPSGQFGTRRMGGKDSASPRYIFTKLEKITRTIFHPDDDALLTHLQDDGMSIEPEYYVPVIPMVLVNGSDGIGTGWSSNIPNFNPRDIIDNIRRLIAGEELKKMVPFYHGFTGEVIPDPGKRSGSYKLLGRIERKDDTTLHISELPVKTWTQNYKQFLEGLISGDEKKKTMPEIKDFKENHTDTTVSFTIQASKEKIDEFEREKDGLYGKFKLSTSIQTSNMNLFDTSGRITTYKTPESILKTFFDVRLDFYHRRKTLLLEKLRREQLMLSNKARFVEEVCSGALIVSNRKRAEILTDLQERGYDLLERESKQRADEEENEEDSDPSDNASDAELARGYEYLLGMKIWSLTFEKAEELRAQLADKVKAVAELEATNPSQIWLNDLDAVEEALDERDEDMQAADQEEIKAQKKNQKRQAKASKKKAKQTKRGKKKADTWDSELEDDSSGDELEMLSDSDEEFVTHKSSAAPRRGRKKTQPVARRKSMSKAASLTSLRKKQDAAVPAKKAPKLAKEDDVVKPRAAAVQPMEELLSSDEELDVESSLFERMKIKKLPISSHTKELSNKAATAAAKRDSSDEDSTMQDSFLDDFDTSTFKPASVTPAVKKRAKKSPPKRGRDSDDEDVKRKSAKPVRDMKKKKDMDEFEFEVSGDDMLPVAAAQPARAKSSRARKNVNYAFDDDSDSDY